MKTRSLLLLATLLSVSTASHAKWLEASTRHFIIYSEAQPKQVTAFAERLERFDQTMRFLHRRPDPELGPANRLTVYVLRNQEQVAKLARDRTKRVAGFYIGRAGASLAVVSDDALVASGNVDVVLFHEYAHHFLQSNFPIGWPVWLGEGFAEFHSTAQIREDGGMSVGLPAEARAYSLLENGHQIPVSKMMSLPVGAPPSDVDSMYARGWLLMHYLLFEPSRSGQLDAYLSGLEQGKPSVAAAAAAFGDMAKLDDDIDAYLGRRFKAAIVPASAMKVNAINLRELPPGEDAIMLLKIKSRRGLDAKQAAEFAPLMRAAAAPFPNDAAVQTMLAEAEFDIDNFEAARAAADRALAADAGHIEALLYKGRSLASLARKAGTRDAEAWREVRKYFLEANRLDAEDPRPLMHYYLSFPGSGQIPTANSVAGLYRALELAPQDLLLRMTAVLQSLRDGEAAQARKSLVLVAANAHAGEAGRRAAAVLEKLDQNGTAAAWQLLLKLRNGTAAAP